MGFETMADGMVRDELPVKFDLLTSNPVYKPFRYPWAYEAWLQWYRTTPDTPCIAICSTSQGDATCKGCGRTFEEVQKWPEMSPGDKRATWRRITLEGDAWRFNRYAERAIE